MSATAPHARAEAAPDSGGAVDATRALALARDVLATEAAGIVGLAARLGGPFVAAVAMIMNCRGRVVVSGIGKSGHVARKLAATLASTGTPAFFVHPAEASHGDLGMITPDDVVLMVSNSGETDELVRWTPISSVRAQRRCADRQRSLVAARPRTCTRCAVDAEACPLGLALRPAQRPRWRWARPRARAARCRGFSVEDFARTPRFSRAQIADVRDVMRSGRDLPTVGVARRGGDR
jgi:arabinose-5-phosphate isomerase